MCTWGDTVDLLVPIPAGLSHTGEPHWATKAIDRCIAPIVQALNAGGVLTASSCCGHGKEEGAILLQDGRVLRIEAPDPALEWAIAAQYIPTDCPVCGKTIRTVEEFKQSQGGRGMHLVHKACWAAYELGEREETSNA